MRQIESLSLAVDSFRGGRCQEGLQNEALILAVAGAVHLRASCREIFPVTSQVELPFRGCGLKSGHGRLNLYSDYGGINNNT